MKLPFVNVTTQTVLGVVVGVLAAGLLLNYGRDLPVVSQARDGFRSGVFG